MSVAILSNAPLWVWPLLAGLIVLGVRQARRRTVPRALVALLPAIMLPLSLWGLRASFGLQAGALLAWAAGLLAALALNAGVLQSPRGVVYRAELDRFEVPGSWLPLALMLAIFGARFAVGAAAAIGPALAHDPDFARALGLLLGFCSGMFLARALQVLRARREPAEGDARGALT